MNWRTLLSAKRKGQKAGVTAESSRSAFEQDYDRIIFSHPFRRLQDKTQVHPLPEHDFVHTRLTHSLEVSSVGRSLGKKAGEVVLQRHADLAADFSLFDFGAIVAAASLAHDLGNPPFGHAGEDALSDFFLHHTAGQSFQKQVTENEWSDLIKFEGNAQGFRILEMEQYGLKLTHATLGAFTKYPCPSLLPGRDKKKKSQKKFGFFHSEKHAFEEVARDLSLPETIRGAWSRHPLAFLVEAADDICYSVIDLEDGCRLGLVTFPETVELLSTILREKLDKNKLGTLSDLNQKLGILRAMTIGTLIDACTEVFLDHEKDILDGSFDQALTDLCAYRDALHTISDISIARIYHARHVVEIEASGHQVLPGLLEEFTSTGEHLLLGTTSRKYSNLAHLLPVEVAFSIRKNNEQPYHMLREIIDFVSGLTDRHALSLYRKIKGISL
ncbi:MAG TPA: dNTP triphosphohydrolase [Chryseosolibacter sp.]|nr:dNTP triphosphohydrolase [Chryseosolibacter sp.]